MPVPCPSWRETVRILEKLPVDDQIALISRIAKDEHRMLMMPWIQALVAKHAPTIARMANEPGVKTDVDTHIKELALPKRVTNALMNGNVETIAELIEYSERDLVRWFCNVGKKSVHEIKEALFDRGLYLSHIDKREKPHGRA